jgi:pyruvate dehydrogenase complex dehydrogenase (E1) component
LAKTAKTIVKIRQVWRQSAFSSPYDVERFHSEARHLDERELEALSALEKKVLWLSAWTIHNANHLRENTDGLKVGGHQASSASLATIMTALYFSVLRPEDRVAVKPHASPVFHAIQYLLGNQTREKLEQFRAFGGAQSYPSRTKDIDDVDFSTGSVGLGVAQTLFASLVQDYLRARDENFAEGRMVALDRRLQPSEPRCRGARRALGTLRKHFPEFWLGCRHPEIRFAPTNRFH